MSAPTTTADPFNERPLPYPRTTPPGDLCPEHRRIWLAYRDLFYKPHNPTEWPGGQHIMDNRTSHTARRNDWIRKSADQMTQIERTCRSGRSPQCGPVTR